MHFFTGADKWKFGARAGLVLLTMTLLFLSFSCAANDNADVTYVLEDEDGEPVEGAEVEIEGVGSAVTNADGEAVFEGLEPGAYSYTARKEGYKDLKGDINVNTTDVNVNVSLDEDLTDLVYTVAEMDGELQLIVPGVFNIIIPYERAASMLGAAEEDMLELLDNDNVLAEMEYRFREAAEPQESFVAFAVQPYTEEEALELLVRIKE